MQKIPASALAYAITFLLLVGLVCTGVLFIASINKRLEVNYAMEEHIIFDNLYILNYGAKISESTEVTIPHVNGDSTKLIVKPWGSFKIVVANTFFQNKSITKTAIIGSRSNYEYATIYIPDEHQTLKVCGSTRIYGTVFSSDRGIERGYLNGKNYTGDKLIYGEHKHSKEVLPELLHYFRNISLQSFRSNVRNIDLPFIDTIFSFHEKTSLISVIEPIVLADKIEGNVIIHSFESITVRSSAQIENVILIAPKVIFEDGFIGSLQVIAHEKVIIGENVLLRYPSTIILNELTTNPDKESRGVFMEEGSSVVGGILIVSQNRDLRNPLLLEMNNSLIGGLIYNVGQTVVKGKIHGYVYTNSFIYKEGGGEYKNHILDAEISSRDLPVELLLPQWIKHSEKSNGEIITWF